MIDFYPDDPIPKPERRSMNGIGSTFKASLARMVEMKSESLSSAFREHFRLAEGDYLEVYREAGGQWKPCRIMAVKDCWFNSGGGWTACLLVAMLNRDGSIGTGRSITVATGATKPFHGVGKEVRKVR